MINNKFERGIIMELTMEKAIENLVKCTQNEASEVLVKLQNLQKEIADLVVRLEDRQKEEGLPTEDISENKEFRKILFQSLKQLDFTVCDLASILRQI